MKTTKTKDVKCTLRY